MLGDRSEGGLTLATNDRTVWAFHKSAIGLAEGMAASTEQKKHLSWLIVNSVQTLLRLMMKVL